MASLVLTGLKPRYPDGTVVGVYPYSGQLAGGDPPAGLIQQQTVSGGAVTFTGLTEGQRYWVIGLVGGVYRWTETNVPEDPLFPPEGQVVRGGDLRRIFGTDVSAGQVYPRLDALEVLGGGAGAAKRFLSPGVSNDHVAINAATLELKNLGGGTLELDEGQFDIGSTLNIYDKVHIVGQGKGTILRKADSSQIWMFKTENFDALNAGITYGGPRDWSIRSLTCNGNKANNTAGGGIAIYGANYVLEDLIVHDFDDHGIYTSWGSPAGTELGTGTGEMEMTMRRVKCIDNAIYGFDILGPHDSVLGECYAIRNAGGGFRIRYAAASTQLYNCHGWGGVQKTALRVEAANVQCYGCQMEVHGGSGICVDIQINDFIWIGGRVYGLTAFNPDNTDKGFRFGGSGDRQGCIIKGVHATECPGGVFDITAMGANNHIEGTVYQTVGTVFTGVTGKEWALQQSYVDVVTSGTAPHGLPTWPITAKAYRPNGLTVRQGLALLEGGMTMQEGSNRHMGVATLVAGSVVVNTTAVQANSRIFITPQTSGTVSAVAVTARTPGTSFTITSISGVDTRDVAWMIVNPA